MVFDVMLLPEQGSCTELYFHPSDTDAAMCRNASLHLRAQSHVSFDAYYNLFPAKVYREYTVCTAPTLCLRAKGNGTAVLIACDADGAVLAEEAADFSSAVPTELSIALQLPEHTAAVYWKCIAASDCELYAAHLSFDEQPQRTVTLAVGICTYRREAFVLQNAARLSALFAKLPQEAHHLFIADNGGTLQEKLTNSAYVTVFQNPNNGGSGGFARVMQEVLRSEIPFTNLLLMDDDVEFRAEILLRLIFFLSHCREEYAQVSVGGAMCLLDQPWMQFESGAKLLQGGILQGLQMYLDLRDAKNCIRNAAAPQEAQYHSWWCCCMSLDQVRKAGLPLPFFFKMDDVEYALRLGQPTISLAGVCVAHEPFEKKYNPALDYYNTRNILITCALHHREYGAVRRVRQLCCAVMRNVLLQRYETAELILRAYADFLKGAEFLKKTDSLQLHREIMQHTPACEPMPPDLQGDAAKPVSNVLRMLTFGGMLLPSDKHCAVVDAFHAGSAEAFRAREICHCYPMMGMMYRTKLSRARAFRLFMKSCGLSVKMLICYKKAKRSYRTNYVFLKGEQFWRKCNGMSRTL